MKRCLLVVENLPLPRDRKVWMEAKALQEGGWEVFTLSPGYPPFRWKEEREGIYLYHYPSPVYTRGRFIYLWEYMNAFFWISLFVVYLVLRKRIGVVQFCNPPEIFFPLILLLRMAGKHPLFDHHDLSPEMYLARFGRRDFFYWITRFCEMFTIISAEKVICPNPYHLRIIQERVPLARDKLILLPPSIDLKIFHPVSPSPILRKGRKFILGYIGVINPQDGVENLVKAMEVMVKDMDFRDFILYIMGDGDSREELEKMVRRKGLEEYIHFTGWLEKEERVREYISSCDLCLDCMPPNPYSHHSSLNKLLLYMAMGKPVVSFSLKVSREILGEGGISVNDPTPEALAESIIDILRRGEDRERKGREGMKRVKERFNWERNRKVYLEIFEEYAG